MTNSPYLVRPGAKVDLGKTRTKDTGSFRDKQDAEEALRANSTELARLQQVLYAEGKRSLLIVLQGMDTSGKDGTIRHVFSGVNPQGCSVVSFKAPSVIELAHDYLWRIHSQAPARGMITIFNRSHYESVLVERVHQLVPEETWMRRYEHINAFERMLVDEGTVILKFFLHISKEEQKARLESRLRDPEKNWKFNARDLDERKLWRDYQEAYADVLLRCSTKHAPWHIVPADHKWFRNWLVSEVVVGSLGGLGLRYPPPVEGIERWKVE